MSTAAVTIGAATLGPLYARAAQESVLHDALAAAPAYRTALTMNLPGNITSSSLVDVSLQLAPDPVPLYPTRISGRQVGVAVQATDSPPVNSTLVTRDDVCAHLVLLQGRCVSGPGEVVVSARTVAGPYGFRLGSTLTLPDITVRAPRAGAVAPAATLTVVGVYTPVDTTQDYWAGRTFFTAAVSYSDGAPDTVDALVVASATFAAFSGVRGEVTIDYPLAVGAVRLSNLSDVAAEVSDLVARASALRATDDLPSVVEGLDEVRASIGVGSLLVSLQLAAVAFFVLFTVTGNALEARGGDVALAKLRGLTAGATLRFLVTETLVLLVLAVPVGALLGDLATRALAAGLLADDIPIVFPPAAGYAALAGFGAACVAAVLAGRRVLRRSVLVQWRGATRTRRSSVLEVVTEVVLGAAAVTGVVLLLSGRSGNLALLGPGLLVLAAALSAIRLLPPLARRRVRRSEHSNRLGGYLAVRQLARRPTALRLGVLLAVTVGLAVFAVAGGSVAERNRVARADIEIGAARTVAVQFAPQSDPVQLVRQADPDGRWAMVVARWVPDGGATVRGAVVGVDPSRLATVATPLPQGASAATVAADIATTVPAAVTVQGTSVSVTVTAADLVGAAPAVTVVVRPTGKAAVSVRLGTLTAGTHVYRGEVPCSSGCRLSGVGWARPVSSFDPISGTVTVSAMTETSSPSSAGSRPVDLRLGDTAAWRAQSPDGTDGQTSGSVTVAADGVHQTFSSVDGGSAGFGRVDTPDALRVWAARNAVAVPPGGAAGPGPLVADGNHASIAVTVGGTSPAVPDGGAQGVLADVSVLQTALPSFTAEATWSVWLGPQAPADALSRLTAAGLGPGAVTSTAARTAELGRQGPSLALALLLACALAMTVLAVGAAVTAVAATGPRRAFELAALRVLGVSRRSLTAATVIEQAVLLGTALLIGVPSGIVAAVVTMPVIPQFSDVSPLPLTDVPGPWRLVLIVAVFVVVLGATALAAGALLVRSALPSRLREMTV